MSEPVGRVANRVRQLRNWLAHHREFVRFAAVGGAAYLVNNVVWYVLKWTVLHTRPVTASVVAVVVATVFSYVLNREWSFNTRGGRRRHVEALLFFTVSGIGMVVNVAGLYISRYVFHLQEPEVSRLVQEMADFLSYSVLGTVAAAGFRWWAFRRWVFPAARPAHAVSIALPAPEVEPDTSVVPAAEREFARI
ncbi:MAG: GtrA family protein [Corynebacteriales bacterium]|nr:GtrA family protein [Mycobacteriales bacterium]